MNALNAPDGVGSLLADESIEVMNIQLLPAAHFVGVEEVIEAANEQLNLNEGIFCQTLVFLHEAQVVSHLREPIRTAHRRS
jgi:hypothetical protein